MVLFLHHKEENERARLDLYQIVLRQNEAALLKSGGSQQHITEQNLVSESYTVQYYYFIKAFF